MGKSKENVGDKRGKATGIAQRRWGAALAAWGSTWPQVCSTLCLGGEGTAGEEQVQKIPSGPPSCSVPVWLETAQSSAFTPVCITGRGKPRTGNQNLEDAQGGVSMRALQPSPACKGHLGHCHQPGRLYLHHRAQAQVRAAALPSPVYLPVLDGHCLPQPCRHKAVKAKCHRSAGDVGVLLQSPPGAVRPDRAAALLQHHVPGGSRLHGCHGSVPATSPSHHAAAAHAGTKGEICE